MNIFNYLIPLALAGVTVVLGLGLYNMMRGGPGNRSQQFMRWRVILQAIALLVVMAALWWGNG